MNLRVTPPEITGRIKIPLLFGCSLFSLALVFGLYQLSDKINHEPNGFIRLFPPHRTKLMRTLDLEYNSYYIAGATPQHVYLANLMTPTLLIKTNYALTDTQRLSLRFAEKTKIASASRVTIDPSNIYVMDGVTPAIFKGRLSDLTVRPMRNCRNYFIGSLPISPQTFILKFFSLSMQKSVLAKKTLGRDSVIRAPDILEKQIDGMFCTDGAMSYDSASSAVVYVYYYRNQFIRMDTSLHVLYRGRTIDTTSHARIKVSHYESKGMSALTAPPVFVNKHSCISGDYIFIHSGLRSNNEEKENFDNSSVIDVYTLKDGKYKLSFYLPDYKKKKVSGFRVFNKTLVALHDRYLVTHRLNF
jgi:hypothetical protein